MASLYRRLKEKMWSYVWPCANLTSYNDNQQYYCKLATSCIYAPRFLTKVLGSMKVIDRTGNGVSLGKLERFMRMYVRVNGDVRAQIAMALKDAIKQGFVQKTGNCYKLRPLTAANFKQFKRCDTPRVKQPEPTKILKCKPKPAKRSECTKNRKRRRMSSCVVSKSPPARNTHISMEETLRAARTPYRPARCEPKHLSLADTLRVLEIPFSQSRTSCENSSVTPPKNEEVNFNADRVSFTVDISAAAAKSSSPLDIGVKGFPWFKLK